MKQHPLLATLIQPDAFTVLVVQESSASKALAAAIGIEEDRLPELSVGRNQITTPLLRVEVLSPYGTPGSIEEYHDRVKYLTEKPVSEDRMAVIVLANWQYEQSTGKFDHPTSRIKIHGLGEVKGTVFAANRVLLVDNMHRVHVTRAPNNEPTGDSLSLADY